MADDLFIVPRRGNTLHRVYIGRPYHTGTATTACGRRIDGVFLPAVGEGDRECATCRRANRKD